MSPWQTQAINNTWCQYIPSDSVFFFIIQITMIAIEIDSGVKPAQPS